MKRSPPRPSRIVPWSAKSRRRRRGTALEMSAPIPPSATIGGPLARRSRNRLGTRRTLLSGRRRPGCRGQAEQSSVERVIDEAAGRRDTRIANAKRPRCGGGDAADATPGGPDAAGAKRTRRSPMRQGLPSSQSSRAEPGGGFARDPFLKWVESGAPVVEDAALHAAGHRHHLAGDVARELV